MTLSALLALHDQLDSQLAAIKRHATAWFKAATAANTRLSIDITITSRNTFTLEVTAPHPSLSAHQRLARGSAQAVLEGAIQSIADTLQAIAQCLNQAPILASLPGQAGFVVKAQWRSDQDMHTFGQILLHKPDDDLSIPLDTWRRNFARIEGGRLRFASTALALMDADCAYFADHHRNREHTFPLWRISEQNQRYGYVLVRARTARDALMLVGGVHTHALLDPNNQVRVDHVIDAPQDLLGQLLYTLEFPPKTA